MKTLFTVDAFSRPGSIQRSLGATTLEQTLAFLDSVRPQILETRRADARDFKAMTDAGKRRLEAVDAVGRAEAALAEQNRIWESSHRNPEALAAAQAALDAAVAAEAEAAQQVAYYRGQVDHHASVLKVLWARVEEAIAQLSPEDQQKARDTMAVCAVSMSGRCMHGEPELGCNKCQAGRKRKKPYDPFKFKMMGRVPVAGMGQFDIKPVVNVNPNVQVSSPINVDLGGLPLSLGLFLGSGLSFMVRGGLPKGWAQSGATIAGAGLGVLGILNLFTAKAAANEAAAQKPAPPAPPPQLVQPTSPQGKPLASEYQPSSEQLLGAVSARIVSPNENDTVDIAPWSGTYPVRVELQNPTQSPIPFVLELVAQESGVYGPAEQSSHTSQVTVNPGAMSVDIAMPIVSGHVLDTVSVTLVAYKRRSAQDPAQMMDMKSFLVK